MKSKLVFSVDLSELSRSLGQAQPQVIEMMRQQMLRAATAFGVAAITGSAAMHQVALSAVALRQNMEEFAATTVARAYGFPIDVAGERLRSFAVRYSTLSFVDVARVVASGQAEPDWSIFVEWML